MESFKGMLERLEMDEEPNREVFLEFAQAANHDPRYRGGRVKRCGAWAIGRTDFFRTVGQSGSGWVTVTLSGQGGRPRLRGTDTGIGLPAMSLSPFTGRTSPAHRKSPVPA